MKRALILVLATLFWPAALASAPLVVFAAASLKEPMDALAAEAGDIVVSYGGSAAMAQQILNGAPADVVVLAHPDWMNVLARSGALRSPPINLLSNSLVLVGPADAQPLALTPSALVEALGEQGRLAIGLTQAVPAGQYGRASLESLGLWPVVADRLAEVDNVRAALLLVARGEAPLGLVYATDAKASDAVAVRAILPAESYPQILYPAARITDDPRAVAFLELLSGPAGQARFAAAGFVPLMEP